MRKLFIIGIIIGVLFLILWGIYEFASIRDNVCLEEIGLEFCKSKGLAYKDMGIELLEFDKFRCQELDYNPRLLDYNPRLTKYPFYHEFYFTEEEWDSCHCDFKEGFIGGCEND